MVIRHSIKELLAKSMVTRPMKCIVTYKILLFIETFWSKDFISYLKNNSSYFLIYNAEEYDIFSEKTSLCNYYDSC